VVSVLLSSQDATALLSYLNLSYKDYYGAYSGADPTAGTLWHPHRDAPYNATDSILPNDPLARYYDASNPNVIRKWGCNLTASPLIFVHIGKAGGGSVRARFAASALNYTRGSRGKSWAKVTDGSYYDVMGNRSYFCNSGHSNRRPNMDARTFEGQLLCEATTPIGRAVACPEPTQASASGSGKRCTVPGCDVGSDSCHQVYVGHNAVGSEFHWLPPKVLRRFWDGISMPGTKRHPDDVAYIDRAIHSLDPATKQIWCRSSHRGPAAWRPHTAEEYTSLYNQCSKALAFSVDEKATEVLGKRLPQFYPPTTTGTRSRVQYMASWAPVYASLPVLRTTVVREPFSWLVSKYFWHYRRMFQGTKCSDPDTRWTEVFATEYIMKLCGEDCYTRLEVMEEDIESLAFQAEGNLRYSFAVVGLVNETDTFYDMTSARVSYVNMSRNLDVSGQMHSTSKKGDYDMCQDLFASEEFQKQVMTKHRAVALLVRLFRVAEEVNRFQIQELRECSSGSQGIV